jgi:hypothetical protein
MPSVTRVAADTPPDKLSAKVQFTRSTAKDPGLITIEAAKFDRATGGRGLAWTVLSNLGHGDAVVALPQGRPATEIRDGVRLDYAVSVARAGPAKVRLRLAPTLDTTGGQGIRIGVSLDDGPVQVVTASLVPTAGAASTPEQVAWVAAVKDHVHTVEAAFQDVAAGAHVVKVWRLDDNAVLEQLIVDMR